MNKLRASNSVGVASCLRYKGHDDYYYSACLKGIGDDDCCCCDWGKAMRRQLNRSVREAIRSLRKQSRRDHAMPGDNGEHGKARGKVTKVKLEAPKGLEGGLNGHV